jgi:hypothetical protein
LFAKAAIHRMKPDPLHATPRPMRFGQPRQFSLAAVFEYTTICAVLSAFSPAVGRMSSVFLMGMALALGAKEGLAALIMLVAASISADWQFGVSGGGLGIHRQLMVAVLAALVCRWYLVRQRIVWPPFSSLAAHRPRSDVVKQT